MTHGAQVIFGGLGRMRICGTPCQKSADRWPFPASRLYGSQHFRRLGYVDYRGGCRYIGDAVPIRADDLVGHSVSGRADDSSRLGNFGSFQHGFRRRGVRSRPRCEHAHHEGLWLGPAKHH